MATYVDSHVHLADSAFDADRNAVIERARLTGARALVCIGESIAVAERAKAIAAEHAGYVYFTAGVHPHDALGFDAERDEAAMRTAATSGAVAIGECGLDYHYDHSPRARQLEVFEHQIALARELGLPLIVHTREAVEDTMTLVKRAGQHDVRGILHCFTGPPQLAQTALDVGWCLSFAGVITFKNWTDDALLRLAPADHVLVESDAPYLAPVPHRGKRNESAWVSLTLARLAASRGVPAETLGEITTENAARLFGFSLASRDAR